MKSKPFLSSETRCCPRRRNDEMDSSPRARSMALGKDFLEAGNSPRMVFSNYGELARAADAEKWFGITLRRWKQSKRRGQRPAVRGQRSEAGECDGSAENGGRGVVG